tara:strand:- start:1545 stop:2108 length:564 start_codon:yes stop_codon:yes gene_type:complete
MAELINYLCPKSTPLSVHLNLNRMSTYTPTHCPETGRKFTKAERKAANKARYASERAAQTPKPKRKKKPVKASKPAKATKAVKRPKRSSEAGLEQAQARTATAQRVGKVKKTKVVHAVTGKEAQPFEPRMEVDVVERKAVKREQMTLTLLPGETPEEGIRRSKIQAASAELEATLLEAEQLTMNFEA